MALFQACELFYLRSDFTRLGNDLCSNRVQSEFILIFFANIGMLSQKQPLYPAIMACFPVASLSGTHPDTLADYTKKLCGQMRLRRPRQVFKWGRLHLHLALTTFDQIVQVKGLFVL